MGRAWSCLFNLLLLCFCGAGLWPWRSCRGSFKRPSSQQSCSTNKNTNKRCFFQTKLVVKIIQRRSKLKISKLTGYVSRSELAWDEGLQVLDLLLILSEQSILGVLVDAGPVLDALGPVGVAQSAQGFLIVVVSRGETGDHQCTRVSSQRVLQQPGELGVPVGDVLGASVHQSGDDVPQGRQGEVDLRGLTESLPCSAGFGLTLTSCQVDEVELTCS